MGANNSVNCDHCGTLVKGVKIEYHQDGWEEEVPDLESKVWSDLKDPGLDYCQACKHLATEDFKEVAVYTRVGLANADRYNNMNKRALQQEPYFVPKYEPDNQPPLPNFLVCAPQAIPRTEPRVVRSCVARGVSNTSKRVRFA